MPDGSLMNVQYELRDYQLFITIENEDMKDFHKANRKEITGLVKENVSEECFRIVWENGTEWWRVKSGKSQLYTLFR